MGLKFDKKFCDKFLLDFLGNRYYIKYMEIEMSFYGIFTIVASIVTI